MRRCLLVFAGSILGLCAATAVAQVQEPSLAEVARQHAAKKAKMVVSDEDFKKDSPKPEQASNSPQTAASAPSATTKPEVAQVPTPVEAAPVASSNSKPDTPAQAEARQKVQELQAQVEFLNRNIQSLQAKLAAGVEDARHQALSDMLVNYQNQLPETNRQLANAQSDLERADQAAARLQ